MPLTNSTSFYPPSDLGIERSSMPGRLLAMLGLVGLLWQTGCTPAPVNTAEGPREYVAQDYERVLNRWTRSARLLSVDQLDNVLSVTATFESWDFRWAYVIRYADDYRLTVDQRRSLLERTLAETRKEHQFYLALSAQKHKWGDLGSNAPAWIIRLIDDVGSETAPSEIVEIKRPGAIENTYFPYTTPWRRAYRVSFPAARADGQPTISKSAHTLGLRFAGAQGNDELTWALAGSAD
ncbi:MAG TPA: hypothetical protein VIV60_03220 [Polyangiaceae bacterium]